MLKNKLRKRGKTIKLLMISNSMSPAVIKEHRILSDTGVHIALRVFDRRRYGRFCYFIMLTRLLSWRITGRYSVVHVQFGGIQSLVAGLIYFRRAIVTFRGTDLHGGGNTHRGVEWLSRRVGVMCSVGASYLIGMILLVSDNLRRHIPLKRKSAALVCTPPVDHNSFRPLDKSECRKRLGLCENKKYILFSDYAFDLVKRRDLADSAISHAKERDPLIELLPVNGRAHGQMPIFINAADATILTSDAEGSPTIVKESLACNVPVISVEVGDVNYLNYDKEYCIICARDHRQLSAAIISVLSRGSRCDSRRAIVGRLGPVPFAAKLIAIYSAVLRQAWGEIDKNNP